MLGGLLWLEPRNKMEVEKEVEKRVLNALDELASCAVLLDKSSLSDPSYFRVEDALYAFLSALLVANSYQSLTGVTIESLLGYKNSMGQDLLMHCLNKHREFFPIGNKNNGQEDVVKAQGYLVLISVLRKWSFKNDSLNLLFPGLRFPTPGEKRLLSKMHQYGVHAQRGHNPFKKSSPEFIQWISDQLSLSLSEFSPNPVQEAARIRKEALQEKPNLPAETSQSQTEVCKSNITHLNLEAVGKNVSFRDNVSNDFQYYLNLLTKSDTQESGLLTYSYEALSGVPIHGEGVDENPKQFSRSEWKKSAHISMKRQIQNNALWNDEFDQQHREDQQQEAVDQRMNLEKEIQKINEEIDFDTTEEIEVHENQEAIFQNEGKFQQDISETINAVTMKASLSGHVKFLGTSAYIEAMIDTLKKEYNFEEVFFSSDFQKKVLDCQGILRKDTSWENLDLKMLPLGVYIHFSKKKVTVKYCALFEAYQKKHAKEYMAGARQKLDAKKTIPHDHPIDLNTLEAHMENFIPIKNEKKEILSKIRELGKEEGDYLDKRETIRKFLFNLTSSQKDAREFHSMLNFLVKLDQWTGKTCDLSQHAHSDPTLLALMSNLLLKEHATPLNVLNSMLERIVALPSPKREWLFYLIDYDKGKGCLLEFLDGIEFFFQFFEEKKIPLGTDPSKVLKGMPYSGSIFFQLQSIINSISYAPYPDLQGKWITSLPQLLERGLQTMKQYGYKAIHEAMGFQNEIIDYLPRQNISQNELCITDSQNEWCITEKQFEQLGWDPKKAREDKCYGLAMRTIWMRFIAYHNLSPETILNLVDVWEKSVHTPLSLYASYSFKGQNNRYPWLTPSERDLEKLNNQIGEAWEKIRKETLSEVHKATALVLESLEKKDEAQQDRVDAATSKQDRVGAATRKLSHPEFSVPEIQRRVTKMQLSPELSRYLTESLISINGNSEALSSLSKTDSYLQDAISIRKKAGEESLYAATRKAFSSKDFPKGLAFLQLAYFLETCRTSKKTPPQGEWLRLEQLAVILLAWSGEYVFEIQPSQGKTAITTMIALGEALQDRRVLLLSHNPHLPELAGQSLLPLATLLGIKVALPSDTFKKKSQAHICFDGSSEALLESLCRNLSLEPEIVYFRKIEEVLQKNPSASKEEIRKKVQADNYYQQKIKKARKEKDEAEVDSFLDEDMNQARRNLPDEKVVIIDEVDQSVVFNSADTSFCVAVPSSSDSIDPNLEAFLMDLYPILEECQRDSSLMTVEEIYTHVEKSFKTKPSVAYFKQLTREEIKEWITAFISASLLTFNKEYTVCPEIRERGGEVKMTCYAVKIVLHNTTGRLNSESIWANGVHQMVAMRVRNALEAHGVPEDCKEFVILPPVNGTLGEASMRKFLKDQFGKRVAVSGTIGQEGSELVKAIPHFLGFSLNFSKKHILYVPMAEKDLLWDDVTWPFRPAPLHHSPHSEAQSDPSDSSEHPEEPFQLEEVNQLKSQSLSAIDPHYSRLYSMMKTVVPDRATWFNVLLTVVVRAHASGNPVMVLFNTIKECQLFETHLLKVKESDERLKNMELQLFYDVPEDSRSLLRPNEKEMTEKAGKPGVITVGSNAIARGVNMRTHGEKGCVLVNASFSSSSVTIQKETRVARDVDAGSVYNVYCVHDLLDSFGVTRMNELLAIPEISSLLEGKKGAMDEEKREEEKEILYEEKREEGKKIPQKSVEEVLREEAFNYFRYVDSNRKNDEAKFFPMPKAVIEWLAMILEGREVKKLQKKDEILSQKEALQEHFIKECTILTELLGPLENEREETDIQEEVKEEVNEEAKEKAKKRHRPQQDERITRLFQQFSHFATRLERAGGFESGEREWKEAYDKEMKPLVEACRTECVKVH